MFPDFHYPHPFENLPIHWQTTIPPPPLVHPLDSIPFHVVNYAFQSKKYVYLGSTVVLHDSFTNARVSSIHDWPKAGAVVACNSPRNARLCKHKYAFSVRIYLRIWNLMKPLDRLLPSSGSARAHSDERRIHCQCWYKLTCNFTSLSHRAHRIHPITKPGRKFMLIFHTHSVERRSVGKLVSARGTFWLDLRRLLLLWRWRWWLWHTYSMIFG